MRMRDDDEEGGLPLAAAWDVSEANRDEKKTRWTLFSKPVACRSSLLIFLSRQISPSIPIHTRHAQDVKHTRITGLAALEDAQSALAALDALVADGTRAGGGDHRRHPAVLRLLSQCPFPQLASYVASGGGAERESSSSSARKSSKRSSESENGSSHCFPPAGGKSARGAASADRRLSEAALVLISGAEAAERAARAAGRLASLPEEEVEALLLAEEAGLGPGAAAAAADADAAPLAGLFSLASAAPVSLAAVADALELLARTRRAVASGEGEKKKEEEEEEQGTGAAPSPCPSSPTSQPLPPAACPWSSPDHLHSYALFWELSPFVDERDVEVALAVERAAWRKRRRKEETEATR